MSIREAELSGKQARCFVWSLNLTLIGQQSQTSSFMSWFLDPLTECVSFILIQPKECNLWLRKTMELAMSSNHRKPQIMLTDQLAIHLFPLTAELHIQCSASESRFLFLFCVSISLTSIVNHLHIHRGFYTNLRFVISYVCMTLKHFLFELSFFKDLLIWKSYKEWSIHWVTPQTPTMVKRGPNMRLKMPSGSPRQVARIQTLQPFPAVLSGALAGSWVRNGASRTHICTYMLLHYCR